MRRGVIAAIVFGVSVCSMSMAAFAGTWEEYAEGRKYRYDDGSYAKWEDNRLVQDSYRISVACPDEGMVYMYAFDEEGWLHTEGPMHRSYTAGSDGRLLYNGLPSGIPIVDYELPVTETVTYRPGGSYRTVISQWKQTLSLDDSVALAEGYTFHLSNTAIFLADNYIGDILKKYEVESVLKIEKYLEDDNWTQYFFKFKGIPYVCELTLYVEPIDGYQCDDYFDEVRDISESRTVMFDLVQGSLLELYGDNFRTGLLQFSQFPNGALYNPQMPYNLLFYYDREFAGGENYIKADYLKGYSSRYRPVFR